MGIGQCVQLKQIPAPPTLSELSYMGEITIQDL